MTNTQSRPVFNLVATSAAVEKCSVVDNTRNNYNRCLLELRERRKKE
jgi:hypothetical protein